ncbi:unnamed protein product [Caenorhabditis sp. 36 PRJEB53466]|nr:unnamed protein product [Caenorhabditis sp. 36 PRJEB53466]
MRFTARFLIIVSIVCIAFVFWLYQSVANRNASIVEIDDEEWNRIVEKRRKEVNESIGCRHILHAFGKKLKVEVLLIDPKVLEMIGKERCRELKAYKERMKVATNSRKDFSSINDRYFDPAYFESDETKDYLEFKFESEPKRIIPKQFETEKFGNLAVPRKPFRFRQFWERSRVVECLNMSMNRNETEPRKLNPKYATFELSRLRDVLVEYDMFPFISEGTLLGWYRECTLIPHTNDIDINIMTTEYNPKFMEDIADGKLGFKLNRRLGKLEDSLELTVSPKSGYKVFTDIFWMYRQPTSNGTDYNWIGSLCGDGEKVRFNFPLFAPFCSADLHGHLVWTTCDPRKIVEHEYGEKWNEDLPSDQYVWHKSVKNVERVGWYSMWQMRKIRFQDGYE